MRVASMIFVFNMAFGLAASSQAQDASSEDLVRSEDAGIGSDALAGGDAGHEDIGYSDVNDIDDVELTDTIFADVDSADAAIDDVLSNDTRNDASSGDSSQTDVSAGDVNADDADLSDSFSNDTYISDAGIEDVLSVDTAWDAGTPCEDITFMGQCDGDMVRYCSNGGLVELDCSLAYGSSASCGLLNCDDADNDDCLGYYCVAKSGQSCTQLTCDVSLQQGCINGVCVQSQRCELETYVPTCNGERIALCDVVVNDFDCNDLQNYASSCVLDDFGAAICAGLAGAPCDPMRPPACAEGHYCDVGICVALVQDAGVDAHRSDSAVADASKDDTSGACGCASAAEIKPRALLALGVLVLLRRRRR